MLRHIIGLFLIANVAVASALSWAAPLEQLGVEFFGAPDTAAFSQTLSPDVSLDDAYDSYMQRYVSNGTFSGTVLIARGGQVVFEKAYGFAERSKPEANDTDTHFLLASMTKQFVAAMTLQEIERGHLSLDDPASRFVSGANPAWANITIRQLLNHSSGIMDYLNSDAIMSKIRDRENKPEEIIDLFKKRALTHPPGSEYSYTNSGYLLLGYILEQVTGTAYPQLVQREIFDKIGMRESGVEDPSHIPRPYATGYSKDRKGRWIKYRYTHPSAAFACGDLYSTVSDLLRWDGGLRDDRVLSARSREMMFTPSAGTYGYGFRLESIANRRTAWHTGHLRGMANMITRFLDDDAVIVLLNNYASSPVKDITNGLASILFDRRILNLPMRLGAETDAY